MRSCVLEIKRGDKNGRRAFNPDGEVSCGSRYARAIAASLAPCDIVHDVATARAHWDTAYDVIVVGYSTIYQEYKLEAAFITAHPAARLYHVATEYENALPAGIYYARRPFVHLANYEKVPQGQTSGGWRLRSAFAHLNLNALLYRDTMPGHAPATRGAIYYGRYREGRLRYLRLLNGSGVEVSTSPKNVCDWIAGGVSDVSWYDALTWHPGRESLRNWKYSVYCEDTYTHKNYNCPANRFYESIACGVVPLVHRSCAGTFARAGYVIPDEWWWSTAADLRRIVAEGVDRTPLAALAAQCAAERATVAAELRSAVT